MSRKAFSAAAWLGLAVIVSACAVDASSDPAQAASSSLDATLAAAVADAPTMKVYKLSTCGCCAQWIEHMREAGFDIEVEDTMEMAAVKLDAGVPPQLQSCHTAVVGDYVFEGHIPAATIARFLSQAPAAKGLAVPGMPVGSPGMEMGDRVDPYDVIAFDAEGNAAVYESHP